MLATNNLIIQCILTVLSIPPPPNPIDAVPVYTGLPACWRVGTIWPLSMAGFQCDIDHLGDTSLSFLVTTRNTINFLCVCVGGGRGKSRSYTLSGPSSVRGDTLAIAGVIASLWGVWQTGYWPSRLL